jgi:hypothetical protein
VGLPKLGWLKISKSSVRNCRFTPSVIFVFFVIEKSVFTKSDQAANPASHCPDGSSPE